jgi:hypothetical protein
MQIQFMQEALDEMNVQIHDVVSDITGVSGLAIIAILAGERDRRRLGALRDGSVTASEESMVAALESNYHPGFLPCSSSRSKATSSIRN